MSVDKNPLHVEILIHLRKNLHVNAELSGNELMTREIISEFIKTHAPSGEIINIGNAGLLVIFDSGAIGKTIMFRADTDALPIEDDPLLPHASVNPGIANKCGHDGHSTILCGLAYMLNKSTPENGKVILLFQPEEETGKGARQILNDPLFLSYKPDYIFALHNLPGFEKGSIIIKKEQFSSASKGMIIKLTGKTAHAAYPEKGVSPALAMAELITRLNDITLENDMFDDFVMITVVYASLGEKAFGTAPGSAEIRVTLRSYNDHNMNRLVHECKLLTEEIAVQNKLGLSIDWSDEFEETYNHAEAVTVIEKAASENNLHIIHMAYPFRWSEDFGQFTARFKGAMFGIGAGKEHAALHTKEYDFPDDIIETGVNMFLSITKNIIH